MYCFLVLNLHRILSKILISSDTLLILDDNINIDAGSNISQSLLEDISI